MTYFPFFWLKDHKPVWALVKCIIALAFTLSLSGPVWAEDRLIHAGYLMIEAGRPIQVQQTVHIRDDKIVAVMAGYVTGGELGVSDAEIVDLRNFFVLPGLIDSHVHITSENSPTGRLDRVQQSSADVAIKASYFAKITLMAGFTTVRDVGARSRDAAFALRDASAKGIIAAPRIYTAGSTISITGGHGDGTQGYRDDVAHILHSTGVCNGTDGCRQAVREQVRAGADLIKLTATGGVLSNTLTGLGQQFTDAELTSIVETAHALGRTVTAHAHGLDGIEGALRAGVDSIEHGTYLDENVAKLFKEKGAYLVPTVLAGVTVAEWAEDPATFLTPAQREKAAIVGPQMRAMARRANQLGIEIAFGTDSGVSKHGINAREFELLVEAGMRPVDAIRTATVNAARLLRVDDRLGTIEVGKWADIIAVSADPQVNISELRDVDFVMKAGTVYKRPE